MPRKSNKQIDETLENQETNVTPEQIDENTIVECLVLKEFKDKYTNQKYKVNKTLKISYKRYKEIINKNKELIKIVER